VTTSKITPEHIELLQARGIPLELAAAAGLESVDGTIAGKLLGRSQACPSDGLAIPYRGSHPTYWRIRMDRGDVRYLCPKGRPVPVYVPPSFEAAGPEDLASTLVVTEAPLKALALTAAGLAAVGLGGVATTLCGDDLHPSWDVLKVAGRDVRLLFDANRASNDHVRAAERRLVEALERAGAAVRVCSLPFTDGGDDQGPDDYFAERGAEALYSVVRSAVHANPWVERIVEVPEDWYTATPPARRWLLRDDRRPKADGLLPLGKVGQVIGQGGISKTMLLFQLSNAVATGTKWCGAFSVATPGRVALVVAEEDYEEGHRRAYNTRRSAHAPIPKPGSIVVLPLAGVPCSMLERDAGGNVVEAPFLSWVRRWLVEHGPWSLIIFDPLSRFGGPDAEGDNAAGTRFIQSLESIATLTGATVLVSHHTNKMSRKAGPIEASAGRGATALTDGVRWQCSLGVERLKLEDPEVQERLGDVVVWSHTKSNYSRRAEDLLLRLDHDNNGALVPLDATDLEIIAAARHRDPEQAAKVAAKEVVREQTMAERDRRTEERRSQAAAAKVAAQQARREAADRALVDVLRERPDVTGTDLRGLLAARIDGCTWERMTDTIARLGDAVTAKTTPGKGHGRSYRLVEAALPEALR
jgi:RecA-family ATPase